jgi:hypothetical protein
MLLPKGGTFLLFVHHKCAMVKLNLFVGFEKGVIGTIGLIGWLPFLNM